MNLSMMARDLVVQTSVLEDYAEGRVATLPEDVMQRIVKYIWPNGTSWDAARDLLVSGGSRPSRSNLGRMITRWPRG